MALQEPKLSFNHELHFSSKDRRQYLCMFCYSMLIQALSSKKSFSHYSQVAYIPRKYEPENDCLLCALILERPQETEKLSHSRIINHEEGELIILANPQREAPLQSLRVVYLALGELPSYELGSRDTLSQTERIMMNSMNAYSAIDRRQLEPQRVRSLDAQIRISTDHNFNISPLIQYKKVSHQPDSEELFQLIHSWIDTCLQQHPHCTDTSTSDLPTRVIDVGPSDGSQMPLLYIPREALHSSSDSNKGRYVALSYCWGLEFCSGRPPLTTTSSTLPARKDGIPMDDLPQTIHDAITITRRLNIQYLWVDALCILQGQDAMDRADWAKESVKMADIYGRAFLTIAAASSRCVYDGILHARESKEENLTELFLGLQYAPYTRGRVYLGSTQSFTNSLDEPLYHHGWTLQERVLSPRVLIYKKDQLAWECQTSATTESGDDLGGVGEMRFWKSAGDALSEEGQKLGTWASELSWQGIMTDYSARALSNPSDKLIAIAGLAKAFATIHNRTSEQYLAGLWRCSLLDDLLWIHEPIALGHRHPRGRPVEDRAPSWSWAAVDGNIRWPMANKIGRGPYHVSVVSASVDASHDESFGNGSKGYITLRGPLKQLSLADIKIHRHSSWTTIGHADSVETIEMHLDASAQSNVSELEFWTAKANIEHIWFLHIKRNAFLILTQAGPGRNSALTGTSFRRLGAAISAEADWLDGFDDQTVTIV